MQYASMHIVQIKSRLIRQPPAKHAALYYGSSLGAVFKGRLRKEESSYVL